MGISLAGEPVKCMVPASISMAVQGWPALAQNQTALVKFNNNQNVPKLRKKCAEKISDLRNGCGYKLMLKFPEFDAITMKDKSFQNFMLKRVLTAVVYCVWNERNQRIFTNSYIDATSL